MISRFRPLLLVLLSLLMATAANACETCGKGKARAQPEKMPADDEAVVRTFGLRADYKGNVLRVTVPPGRDLLPTVDGVPLPHAFGFNGWLAFTPGDRGRHVMMGDLVLSEEEVNPIMSKVLESGLKVTALHNHFLWETPRIFYMHVHGVGDAVEMAMNMRPAIGLIGAFKPPQPAPADPNRIVGVEGVMVKGAELDPIVGHTADNLAGVVKYTIGRDDLKVKEHGATINARMGLNSWASFWGSGEN